MTTEATMLLLLRQFSSEEFANKAQQIQDFLDDLPTTDPRRAEADRLQGEVARWMFLLIRNARSIGFAVPGLEFNQNATDMHGVAVSLKVAADPSDSYVHAFRQVLKTMDLLRILENPDLTLTNDVGDLG